jgi:hypothetical protein
MVQDHTMEDFDNDQRQRNNIQKEMEDMRKLLQQLEETQGVGRGIEPVSAASYIGAEAGSSEQARIHMIAQPRLMFHVTPSMLHMDKFQGRHP